MPDVIPHATNNANITWYCINCSQIPVLVTWMHFYASISPSCVCVYGLFSWPFTLSISIDFGWLFKDRPKVDNSILNFKIATSENTKRHHRVQNFWTCGQHRLDVRTVLFHNQYFTFSLLFVMTYPDTFIRMCLRCPVPASPACSWRVLMPHPRPAQWPRAKLTIPWTYYMVGAGPSEASQWQSPISRVVFRAHPNRRMPRLSWARNLCYERWYQRMKSGSFIPPALPSCSRKKNEFKNTYGVKNVFFIHTKTWTHAICKCVCVAHMCAYMGLKKVSPLSELGNQQACARASCWVRSWVDRESKDGTAAWYICNMTVWKNIYI